MFLKSFERSRSQLDDSSNEEKKVGLVHIIPLECQSNGKALRLSIRPFMSDIVSRSTRSRHSYSSVMAAVDDAVDRTCSDGKFKMTRRNSSTVFNPAIEPNEEEFELLVKYFKSDSEWYQSVSSSKN